MNPKGDYLPVESNAPLRGLNTTLPSTRLDPSFSPTLLNVVVRDGIAKRRAGYQQIGQRLVGRVLAITQFGELGEDANTVVLTSHRQYAFKESTNAFVDLTPGQVNHTILAVTVGPPSSFQVTGNQTVLFPVGRLIPVVGGANEGVYTVVSSSYSGGPNRTTVVVSETAPSAVVAGVITTASDLTTGERDLIDFVAITDINSHRFIMTNGVNAPRVWNGDLTSPFTTWAPNFTNFVTCRSLCVFAEHLFLGSVVTVTEEPQLIAWSAAGDFDEFETGDSGAQLLYQLITPIKGMKVLGDRLAIYSTDAISTAVFVGLPAIFAFEIVIPEGTRLISPHVIVSINVGHIFVSEENWYLFDGSRGLRILGDPIYSDYKIFKDQSLLHRCCALNDYSKRTLYFSIPDSVFGGANVYTCVYDVFNIANVSWGKEKYRNAPTAWGFHTRHTGEVTWEDSAALGESANQPWSEEIGAWAEEAEQLEFPIRCFGDPDGNVFLCTEGILSDDGTIERQAYHTMDFTVPEAFHSLLGRWLEIEFEALGGSVGVYTSVDHGRTLVLVEEVTLSDDYTAYRMNIDLVSRNLRIRFDSEDSYYNLRWVRVWVRSAGPH